MKLLAAVLQIAGLASCSVGLGLTLGPGAGLVAAGASLVLVGLAAER